MPMIADIVMPTARGVGTATTLTSSSSISRAIRLRTVVSVTWRTRAMSVLLVRPLRCSTRMISRSTSSTTPRRRSSVARVPCAARRRWSPTNLAMYDITVPSH
jgi:hypothetical protein